MMQRFIFFTTSLLGLMILFSCKSQSKQVASSGPRPTSDSTVYKGVTDNACAAEVAFGSYGAGIDGPAFERVLKAIEDRKLAFTAKNIGREGETRICLPLTELKSKEKNEFLDQLKKIAKEAQLMSVSIR
jgi:hypothetical protein